MCDVPVGLNVGPFHRRTPALRSDVPEQVTLVGGGPSMTRIVFDPFDRAARSALPRRTLLRALGGGLVASAAFGGLGLARPELADAKATQRPISDFLATQGADETFLFIPPIPNFIGWGNNPTT